VKKPVVVIKQDGRAEAIELTQADICEILKALHCRQNARSVELIDKLTKAVRNEAGTVECDMP
jgi:hypothetical protein